LCKTSENDPELSFSHCDDPDRRPGLSFCHTTTAFGGIHPVPRVSRADVPTGLVLLEKKQSERDEKEAQKSAGIFGS